MILRVKREQRATATPDPELQQQIQKACPTLQRYVARLETENARLLDRVADLQVQNLTNRNYIRALNKQLRLLAAARKAADAAAEQRHAAAAQALTDIVCRDDAPPPQS